MLFQIVNRYICIQMEQIHCIRLHSVPRIIISLIYHKNFSNNNILSSHFIASVLPFLFTFHHQNIYFRQVTYLITI